MDQQLAPKWREQTGRHLPNTTVSDQAYRHRFEHSAAVPILATEPVGAIHGRQSVRQVICSGKCQHHRGFSYAIDVFIALAICNQNAALSRGRYIESLHAGERRNQSSQVRYGVQDHRPDGGATEYADDVHPFELTELVSDRISTQDRNHILSLFAQQMRNAAHDGIAVVYDDSAHADNFLRSRAISLSASLSKHSLVSERSVIMPPNLRDSSGAISDTLPTTANCC